MTMLGRKILFVALLPLAAPGLACSDSAPARVDGKAKVPHAAPPTSGARSKQTMTKQGQVGDEKQGWAEAEALLRKHYEKKRKQVKQLEPYPALPFLFSAVLGAGAEHVLVQGGQIVTDRGLGALGMYVNKSGVLARPALSARDVLHLVEVLGAYPPVKGYANPPGYYQNPKDDAPLSPLNPKLLRDGKTRFVLHYLIPQAAAPNHGSPAGGGTPVARWTLGFPEGGPPTWSEERLLFEAQGGTFKAAN